MSSAVFKFTSSTIAVQKIQRGIIPKNVGGDNVCFCASADNTLYSLLPWPTSFPLVFAEQFFN